jgi:membrane protease YdiL (CAAX protease family)
LVERSSPKRQVAGSSPAAPAEINSAFRTAVLLWCLGYKPRHHTRVARRSVRRLVLPSGLLVAFRVLAAIMAYLVVFSSASVGLYLLGLRLVPGADRGAAGFVGLGVAEALAFGTVLVFWRFVDGRRVRDLGLDPRFATRQWPRGAGVALLMMGFIVLAGYTLLDGATWELNGDTLRAAAVLVGGLAGFVVQGPAEEVLFRGYVFENLREEWGLRWAVGLSALGFALWHALNPAFSPLALLNLFLFGVATALYKVRIDRGQLWGVFAIHTAWNWLQQVVFGLPNSGIASTADNALFTVTPNTSLPGPIWGGGFGPEGTLAASLVLAALIGVALRRSPVPSSSGAASSSARER